LDAEPPEPEHPATQRKPVGPDPTIREFHASTMKRYLSASRTIPVGRLSVIVVVDDVAPASVTPDNCPD
jgi:hypothetical protein